MSLSAALLALERAAADVGDYLPANLDDDGLMALSEAWLPPSKGNHASKVRRVKLWIDWIADCSERWPARDIEPDVGGLVIAWARSRAPADSADVQAVIPRGLDGPKNTS